MNGNVLTIYPNDLGLEEMAREVSSILKSPSFQKVDDAVVSKLKESIEHKKKPRTLIVPRDPKDQGRRLVDSFRFFGTAPDPLCISHFDGRFAIMNPAWEKVTGWAMDKIQGTHRLNFIHPEDHEKAAVAELRLRNGEPIEDLEIRFICRSGEINYPAASGRGIRTTTIADVYIVSGTPRPDFLHSCRLCPHSHVFQPCFRNSHPSRIRLPTVPFSLGDNV